MSPAIHVNMNRKNLLQNLFSMVLIQQIMCEPSEINISIKEEHKEGIKVATIAHIFTPPYQVLTPDMYLRLDSDTGDLYTTTHRMDREFLCPEQSGDCLIQHFIIVGPERDVVKVNVVLEDINDNAPCFHKSEIHLSISEDVNVGTSFLLDDQAWDKDVGINGKVQYSLDTLSSFFRVEEEGPSPVVVVQGELDRETQSIHRMILFATDYGFPPQTGTTILVVEVRDINDNCPTFPSDAPQTATIQENSPRGTVVTQVKAIDPDLGPNAAITYSYSPKTSRRSQVLFDLDQDTGQITLSSTIKSGDASEHRLKVQASGPLCSPAAAEINVSILRAVSRQPVINIKLIAEHSNHTILLKENKPSTILAVLELSELFTGTLCIDGKVPFLLKPQDGRYHLFSSKPLDFEQKSKYYVSISVNSTPITNHKIIIPVQVEDVNDNVPQFHQILYEVYVSENNVPGVFLVQVAATDADSLQNGKVVYRLRPDVDALFRINHTTGQLFLMASLDREQQDSHRITVVARDSGSPALEATATVIVNVLDQNDNKPIFLNPSFTFFIPENFPLLGRVGLLGVKDADKEENGQVEMQMLNGSGPFVVDNSQSIMRCAAELDREKQDRYELWVLARDRGQPSLSSTAKVTVFIEDVNDNQPHIILPSSNFSCLTVLPDTALGSTITRIFAIDKDSGINSDISYHIGACEPPGCSSFQIGAHSGNITLAQQLLLKDYGIHRLLIVVRDSGRPVPLQSTVWVNLLVNTSLEPCHVNNIPKSIPQIAITANSCKSDETSANQSRLVFMVGLCMMACSFFMFLGTGIACIKQRSERKKTKKYDKAIPLKLMEDCHNDNWIH
ncbi:protocadherin-20 isoform X1 [Paramormyrops kingsleyae]|uniref:Protocadherin-20 n=2 Tax=Paramormyrops kingsleyae TaxID=1676925 RepID=A0A3B3SYS4_9TELE|nr:protocadherin-20-like isoform X1 [Paramormyrops kingsleyae]